MEKTHLVARCGLYCGHCPKYKNGKCQGCTQNAKASWCKIRSCTLEQNILSCADCKTTTVEDCKIFNHPIGKIMGLVFNSDRKGGIKMIKEQGYEAFVLHLEGINRMALPLRKK